MLDLTARPTSRIGLLAIFLAALTLGSAFAAPPTYIPNQTSIMPGGISTGDLQTVNLTLGNGTTVTVAYNATSGRFEWVGADQQWNVNSIFGTNKALTLKTNSSAAGMTWGQISRLVSLQAQTDVDRPAIVWVDKNGRQQAALYWHDLNAADGARHHDLEIKTSVDPNSTDPSAMRTRIGIETDTNVSRFTHAYTDIVSVERDFSQNTNLGIEYRMEDPTGATRKIAESYAILGASNDTSMSLSPMSWSGTEASRFRLFRDTNTTGGRTFSIFKGDGTATATFVVDAATGALTQVANITATGTFTNTGPVALNGTVTVGPTPGKTTTQSQFGSSSETSYLIDPVAADVGRNVFLKLFRNSDAAGGAFVMYAANNSGTETFKVDARTGDIQRTANVNLIGTSPILRFKTPLGGVDTDIAKLQSTVGASGESILSIDPTSQNTSTGAHLRAFRNTNTLGSRTFTMFKGDGTNTETVKFDAAKGDLSLVTNVTASGNITAKNRFILNNYLGVTGLRASGEGSNSMDLAFYPPGLLKRNRIEFWDRPLNETPVWRPLSIETHGPNDVNSAEYHVSFYTDNGTSYEAKTIEWHWGPGWDDRVKVYPNLHLQKQLWVNGTARSVRNSSVTDPTTYPVGIITYNADTTNGNGITYGFTGNDTLGAEREFAGIRGHFVDHDGASLDGELSFWISIANTRREVAHVNATTWRLNKTLDEQNSVPGFVVAEGATSVTVTLETSEPNAGYGVTCTPGWNAYAWVPPATKGTTSYVVQFSAAAPASASVDCRVFR